MTMLESIKTCFGKYAQFSGRAQRSEYWWFVLFNLLMTFLLKIVDGALFGTVEAGVSTIYGLAVLLPSIAVAVRRLHDINYTGWFTFLFFIPIVGLILVLLWMTREGTEGPNKYGPDPLGRDSIPGTGTEVTTQPTATAQQSQEL